MTFNYLYNFSSQVRCLLLASNVTLLVHPLQNLQILTSQDLYNRAKYCRNKHQIIYRRLLLIIKLLFSFPQDHTRARGGGRCCLNLVSQFTAAAVGQIPVYYFAQFSEMCARAIVLLSVPFSFLLLAGEAAAFTTCTHVRAHSRFVR